MSWDFDSGRLALDFVNTVQWRGREPPEELLNSVSDLIAWAEEGGILPSKGRKRQIKEQQVGAPNQASTLEKAKTFREGLHRIFSKIIAGVPPEDGDLRILQEMNSSRMVEAKLKWENGRLNWVWKDEENVFDRIMWSVAQDALDLLMGENLDRVGQCADDRGCGYLFIDTTRNHSRRWCSMESCGNRAKARKHYRRSRKSKLGEKEIE